MNVSDNVRSAQNADHNNADYEHATSWMMYCIPVSIM